MAYNPSSYGTLFLTSLTLPSGDERTAPGTLSSVAGRLDAYDSYGRVPSIYSDDLVEHRGKKPVEDAGPALVPFVSPPPPEKLSLKHRYYSLARSETGNAHGMTEWEKNVMLARLRRADPVDEEDFQRRLGNARMRNTDAYINSVRQRVWDNAEKAALQREEAFLVQEERREQIFFRHKNLLQLREREKFITRAQLWYHVVVCHVFLTALIQERKVQEAMETFSHLLAPMIKCHVALKWRRRDAQALTRSQLPNIPFPYPPVIQSMKGTFFDGWPPLLLEKLVANATPTYLTKGSYLMHEGDIGRVMFMITTGTVSIILRKKGKDKRRTKDNSSGVFAITAPCYVGEFALVCKEPRTASIYCETDIGYWAVRPDDYEDVARHLSPEVASKQREATDVRRRQNLQKFFPLRVDFLRKFPHFEQFSNISLERIIACVEPLVLHDGDFLFQCGEMDSSVYFIQDGIAVKRDADGNESKVTTGSCVGVFECSCGVNERKQSAIVSVNYCDVWRMRRETLIDVGMSEPVALLHCRHSAKADRALAVCREAKTPLFLRNDPFLSFCFPVAWINKLYDLCTPVVYLNGEKITVMGQSVGTLVVLLSGVVDVTIANNGEQKTHRLDVAQTRTRLAYTASSGAPAGGSGGAMATGRRTLPLAGKKTSPVPPASAGGTGEAGSASDSDPSPVTLVLGAYELAASVPQYTYTVTSFGLTEALQVDKAQLEAVLPPDLRAIIHENLRSREIVVKAYKRRSLGLLVQNASCSFAHLYKEFRDNERDRGRKRAHNM